MTSQIFEFMGFIKMFTKSMMKKIPTCSKTLPVCTGLLEHNNYNISPPNCKKMLIFWQEGIFHHALSNYLSKSHNFGNLVLVMSSH